MRRSKLNNNASQHKYPTDIRNYKKKTTKMCCKPKEKGKTFWVNCKPYFKNKHIKADNDIMLNENGELILRLYEMIYFE